MNYIVDGKEGKLTQGGTVSIPPHVPHTFWNAKGSEEELDVEITVTGGPNPGFDERFGESSLYLLCSLNIWLVRQFCELKETCVRGGFS
jgi:hypothetical protein